MSTKTLSCPCLSTMKKNKNLLSGQLENCQYISGFFESSTDRSLNDKDIKAKTFRNFVVEKADFTSNTFRNCRFREVVFIECALVGVTFSECSFHDCTIINGENDYFIEKSTIESFSHMRIGDLELIERCKERALKIQGS